MSWVFHRAVCFAALLGLCQLAFSDPDPSCLFGLSQQHQLTSDPATAAALGTQVGESHSSTLASPVEAPHEVAAATARDRERLAQTFEEATSQLNGVNHDTRQAIADTLIRNPSADGVYSPLMQIGNAFAGTQYELAASALDPELQRQTLVINAGAADKISPVFSGNPRAGAVETGGGNSIHEKQDYILVGPWGRVEPDQLHGRAWGGKSRGANETNGTNQAVHASGIASNPQLYGARVVETQYRELLPPGEASKWSFNSAARSLVEYEVTPEYREYLKKQFGMSDAAIDAQLNALRKKTIEVTDESGHTIRIPMVRDVTRGGKTTTTMSHWVYYQGALVAGGLPDPNIIVGDQAHPFRQIGRNWYGYLTQVRANGGALESRPLIGSADLDIHLRYGEPLPVTSVTAAMGPGDSSFIKVQKLYKELQARHPGLPTSEISKLMPPQIFIGREASLQPSNTRELFDPKLPYYGRFRLINTSQVKDAQIVDRQGNPISIALENADGSARPYAEIAAELKENGAQIKTVMEKPKPITNLKELASFFRKDGQPLDVSTFLQEAFLPYSFYLPEYLNRDGTVNRAAIRALGDHPERALKAGVVERLLAEGFQNAEGQAGLNNIRRLAKDGESGPRFTEDSDGNLIGLFDHMDFSQSYNAERLFQRELAHKKGEATLTFNNVVSSDVPHLEPTDGPQLVGRQSAGFRNAAGQTIPGTPPTVFTAGAINGVMGGKLLADGNSPGAVGTGILNSFRRLGFNFSPFGLESQLQAVRALSAPALQAFRRDLDASKSSVKSASGLPAQSLAGAMASQVRAQNPEKALVAPRPGDSAMAEITVPGQGLAGPITIATGREKPVVENALYHEIFKRYWGPNTPNGYEVRFKLSPDGHLHVITPDTGTSTLARNIAFDLGRNTKLAQSLREILQGIGGEAEMQIRTNADGTVQAQSVRFETPQEALAKSIQSLTRQNGTAALENPDNRRNLISTMKASPIVFSFDPKSKQVTNADDPRVHQQILDHVRMGGIASADRVIPEKPGARATSFLAADGKERIYLLGDANGNPVGAAIAAYDPESITRVLRYVAGEQRFREAGVGQREVVTVMRIPPQNDLRQTSGIMIVVRAGGGHPLGSLDPAKRLAAIERTASDMAKLAVQGEENERPHSADVDRARRADTFLQRSITELKSNAGSSRANEIIDAAAARVPRDPFYQGPVHGGLRHDKIFYSEKLNDEGKPETVADYYNFYNSRYGNITMDLASYCQGLKPFEQEAFLRRYVTKRIQAIQGSEYTDQEVDRRVAEIRNSFEFWNLVFARNQALQYLATKPQTPAAPYTP